MEKAHGCRNHFKCLRYSNEVRILNSIFWDLLFYLQMRWGYLEPFVGWDCCFAFKWLKDSNEIKLVTAICPPFCDAFQMFDRLKWEEGTYFELFARFLKLYFQVFERLVLQESNNNAPWICSTYSLICFPLD